MKMSEQTSNNDSLSPPTVRDCCFDLEQPSIMTSVDPHDDDNSSNYNYEEVEDDYDDVSLNENSTSSCSYFFKMPPQIERRHEYLYKHLHCQHQSNDVVYISSTTPNDGDDGDGSLSSISISELGPVSVDADVKIDLPNTSNSFFSPSWDDDFDDTPSVCSTSWGTPKRTATFPALPEPIDFENCVFSFLDTFDKLCHRVATCGGSYDKGGERGREIYHHKEGNRSASTNTYIYLPSFD